MNTQERTNFLNLLPLLKPHLTELSWGFFWMLIYVLCWPILAWLAGKLIPAIGSGNIKIVINVIIKAILVFSIQKIAQYMQDSILAKPTLKIIRELRIDLFRQLQKKELSSIEKLSSGDLTYRLTEDADRVGEVIYKTIQDTAPSILQLIAVILYMIFLDIKLSLATLILAPLITLLVGKFGEKVMKAAERSQKQVSDLAGLLAEAIQGLPLIRAYAAEGWLQEKFENEVELHKNARYKTLKLIALQHPIIGFIEACGILLILLIGAYRIKTGELNSQEFSSYFAALLMLIDPISHITINMNELQQGKASLKRLKDLEKEKNEREDIIDAITIKSSKGEIKFNSISFAYENKIKVVNNLNFIINSGEVVALVGPSGAGKSTIFSLLMRFIYPQNGYIELDGLDIMNIKSKNLRKEIALVPQKTTVFSGTISEAISFGRKATKQEIIRAAKIANAHNFITNIPNSYESFIEERGTNLSGGQLQRISIARAVLGNPSVLLLDEATSALDAEAEESVQKGLKQAMSGRTVLVIAHRLATVQEASKIMVIEKGSLVEVGNHDELMIRNGRYRDLCQKQFIRDIS